jgi:hypothetical protein
MGKSLTTKIPWEQANTLWASLLNPLLSNSSNQSLILQNIRLISGTVNVINHRLGRLMQGWEISDMQAPGCTLFRAAPFNAQTLSLVASVNCTVNLRVY